MILDIDKSPRPSIRLNWLRGLDLNQRPLGYEFSNVAL
jgi:hypothetical protein